MEATDIIMISVCVPLLIMMGVLCYLMIAMILKEEFNKTIWPFNKKEDK
jgi:hypothetical protein